MRFSAKTLIAATSMVIGVLVTYLGSWIASDYGQSVAANAGSLFAGLGIGIVVTEIYLDRGRKRDITAALLDLIEPVLDNAQHRVLDCTYRSFSIDEFSSLVSRYARSNGRLQALTEPERSILERSVIANHQVLTTNFTELHGAMQMLTEMVGASILDRKLLMEALRCRTSIERFLSIGIELRDPEDRIDRLCQFLDAVIRAFSVFALMEELSGRRPQDSKSAAILQLEPAGSMRFRRAAGGGGSLRVRS